MFNMVCLYNFGQTLNRNFLKIICLFYKLKQSKNDVPPGAGARVLFGLKLLAVPFDQRGIAPRAIHILGKATAACTVY